jgi:CBS domain containing-hemolysin-like protein
MNTLETSQNKQEGKHEGKVTKKLEEQTARVPSLTYMGLAVGSMIASAVCMATGRRQLAQFIGQWVPSLLIIGVYNKLVKAEHELLEGQARVQRTI